MNNNIYRANNKRNLTVEELALFELREEARNNCFGKGSNQLLKEFYKARIEMSPKAHRLLGDREALIRSLEHDD